jgi:hypothetical protein
MVRQALEKKRRAEWPRKRVRTRIKRKARRRVKRRERRSKGSSIILHLQTKHQINMYEDSRTRAS